MVKTIFEKHELIKGDFCKSILSNNIRYFKVKEVLKERILLDGYCVFNKKYYDLAPKAYVENNYYIKVSINEFVEFLPDNHPDKRNYMRRQKIDYLLKI